MPDEAETETNITINIADTVPLSLYQDKQRRIRTMSHALNEQRAKLERKAVVIDALCDYIYRHCRGEFEDVTADILRIRSIGLEKKDA